MSAGVADDGSRDILWNTDFYSLLIWLITREDFIPTAVFIFLHYLFHVYTSVSDED
jgi:hypothetical protein